MHETADGAWKLGVDVGGTFTDGVLFNESTGEVYKAKVPSTPHDQSQGVLDAIRSLKAQVSNGNEIRIASLNHGTTVATNAILEGKGANVALLVTEGYKDILQVRRSHVPGGLAGWITWPKPEPLAPLELTVEVPGRISCSGEIVRPFDERILRSRLAKLKAMKPKPESITISLINSFANPLHERQVAQVVHTEFPDLPLSLSSDVLPEIMEYERTVTTVANAYVKPIVHRYLGYLEDRLQGMEVKVLRSDGGLSNASVAKEHCATLLYSGPAGGITGVINQVARTTQYKNLLTFDMGGTSTDVCLIEDGKPGLRRESTIGDLTIRAPSIDVRTVGAGGGSIASVADMTGALRVGPESAGAVPGPVCYNKGGIKPTVTDAFAVLGYLPQALLGGSFQLDIDAAFKAIQDSIMKPMKLANVVEAAEGILRITLEKMYGSLRGVSVEKGKDPRDYHLVSFGGAGGLVACELAKICGVKYPIIVPPSPGVLCAFGDACTGVRHEASTTFIRRLKDISVTDFQSACADLEEQVVKFLLKQGAPNLVCTFEVDLRYRGQATNLPVSFKLEEIFDSGFRVLEKRFEEQHTSLFTFSLDLDVEMVNLRAVAQEVVKDMLSQPLERGDGVPTKEAIRSTTSIHYGGKEYNTVPVFDRARLRLGDILSGPCIVTETDSTTFIAPNHRASIDGIANILIWFQPEGTERAERNLPSAPELDPIVVQLVEAGLQNIRMEMDALIQRVAMSPAMREQLDYFPMIAAGEGPHSGKMVCGQFGSFIPGFLMSWDETIDEGDVFLTNDPYSCSNAISHLNDFLVVTPVHFRGKIVAWAANLGHFTDIGSSVPGSMPSCARSIHEDGVQIPLCKLYSRNIPNMAIVERNSRKPDFAKSDLRALVAATRIAARRVIEICERFGTEAYEKALDILLSRNKLAIGKIIRTTLSSEHVHFEDYIDDDGFGVGPWKIACTMWKEPNEHGDEIVVLDFDGTDPQSDRSTNFALSHEMLKMFVVFYLLTVFDPATVVNDGSFDLIKILIPEGTILNPIRPSALSCRTPLLGRLFDIMGAVFGQKTPEFLCAAGYSDSPHLFYSGWNQAGEWFQLYQIGFGGIPSRPHGDGPDGHSMWPSMRSVPNEFLESYLPLRVDKYETVPDSGGEGLYRGGNAIRIDYAFLDDGDISIHDDRWYTKPWGVNGGGVGTRSTKTLVRYSVDRQNPPRQRLQSKEDFVKVAVGDVLEWVTWGGGGYGSPLDRDPELVAKEVRRGLVKEPSRYGVCLTAAGEVDYRATESLRTQMKPQQDLLSREVFNRGGSMKELRERCLEETGLPPPRLPSERTLRGPVARLPHVIELQARRKVEDGLLYM